MRRRRALDGRTTPTSTGFSSRWPGSRARSPDARAAVLGAGGAARAVVVALRRERRATSRVHARRAGAGAASSRRRSTRRRARGRRRRELGSAGQLHAVGVYPRATIAAAGRADRGPLRLRPVYNPATTRCCARRRGGMPDDRRPRMLVAQAQRAVRVVDRQRPAPGVMREAAAHALRADSGGVDATSDENHVV